MVVVFIHRTVFCIVFCFSDALCVVFCLFMRLFSLPGVLWSLGGNELHCCSYYTRVLDLKSPVYTIYFVNTCKQQWCKAEVKILIFSHSNGCNDLGGTDRFHFPVISNKEFLKIIPFCVYLSSFYLMCVDLCMQRQVKRSENNIQESLLSPPWN